MTKLTWLAVGGLAFALLAQPVAAGPFAQPADAIARAASSNNGVVQVHYCNRLCRLGPVPRWGGVIRLHRHVGPACIPVAC